MSFFVQFLYCFIGYWEKNITLQIVTRIQAYHILLYLDFYDKSVIEDKTEKPFSLQDTLQIFMVILLCKSIKVIGVIHNLMIENFFCKFHHWNPGIAKQLSKSSKNKSQWCPELLSVCSKFWYECKIVSIGNNL